jgi:hypothetical protein
MNERLLFIAWLVDWLIVLDAGWSLVSVADNDDEGCTACLTYLPVTYIHQQSVTNTVC